MWLLCICLLCEQYVAWKNLPCDTLRFYHYRLLHPIPYPPLFHEHHDLYRGRYNILKCSRGWLKEEEWLKSYFLKTGVGDSCELCYNLRQGGIDLMKRNYYLFPC